MKTGNLEWSDCKGCDGRAYGDHDRCVLCRRTTGQQTFSDVRQHSEPDSQANPERDEK